MVFEAVNYEVKNNIGYVTLNRPDKLNALNWQTMIEIKAAFERIKNDVSVKGVILTGSGPKAFAAGADIAELAEKSPVQAKQFALESQEILRTIEHSQKPVVAAVNGFCLGGGNELAMACHMRWASEKAKFGQPEVNLGLICGNGGTQRLARLVGKGRAIEILISGKIIGAEEAFQIGLVNHVVKPDALLPACEEFLKTVFAKAPVAVGLSIEAVQHGMEMTLEEAIAFEANQFGLVAATEDSKEGTTAFLEKRPASFSGK